jgi:Fe-S-cluster containining protein
MRRKVLDGFLYTHARLGEGTKQILESSAFLYALIELLEEKGVISVNDLDQRKKIVAGRLVEKNKEKGLGVVIQDPEFDKYEFKEEVSINCSERLEYCHAACCKLPFALSRQDIREGVVRWDLGQPYMIEQNDRGYCTHLDEHSSCCSVHEQRPVPCRAYDCRNDNKIWLDFDNFKVNPDILSDDWPQNVSVDREGWDR